MSCLMDNLELFWLDLVVDRMNRVVGQHMLVEQNMLDMLDLSCLVDNLEFFWLDLVVDRRSRVVG